MYAHSIPGQSQEHWEPLPLHLARVAERAEQFAGVFGAGALGRAAGWWHDLGKASLAFQEGVLGAGADEAEADAVDIDKDSSSAPRRRRVDHSTAGARRAIDILGQPMGYLLAYGIAGHHGRLPDYSRGSTGTLAERLDPRQRTIEPITPTAAVQYTADPAAMVPQHFQLDPSDVPRRAFQCSLLTRMLYSALVDADRLATEGFCDPDRAAQRPDGGPGIAALLEQLNAHLETLTRTRANDPAPVDQHRQAVLQACRDRAPQPPGLFSLTVPTGGGKTLASLAFALEHARHHGQRRVVFALPYTSIIEQTAAVFRDIFGEAHVLEHHSNLDEETRDRRSLSAQLAAENFDAPIVVTTNVQLFESLFSAHGSTCRKLHRLARSVLVLDEAQSIPPWLLRPTLAVLDELVRNYGCTVVLCTATQPAVTRRDSFPIGLDRVTEIVPDPRTLYQAMRRVTVTPVGHLDDEALADRLALHKQALCIVNTRPHAADPSLAAMGKQADWDQHHQGDLACV